MTTTPTTTAPRRTLAQLLESPRVRDFVNTWSEEAIYQVADDGISRKEAIVLLADDLRHKQEKEVPEFTPVLRALEAAAGPQQIVAFETVGAPASCPAVTVLTPAQFEARFPTMFRMQAQDDEEAGLADPCGGQVAAAALVGHVLDAAARAGKIVIADTFTEEQRLTRLGGLFEQLSTVCRAAAKGERCCERAPAQEDLQRDLRSARAQRLLLTPCMDALEAHRLEVEREVLARHRRAMEQAPSQKQLYREAKRATRDYFTRAVARRLGVQRDSL